MANIENIRISLALGGGGVRGLAHIGVLRALEKSGLRITAVTGTSMGAVIAAMYALGMNPDEIESAALASGSRSLILKFADISSKGRGTISGAAVAARLKAICRGRTFSQTRIPLQIVCVDLENGAEVVIKAGDIATAVQASLSLPGIFPPVRIGGRLLIDGGMSNPTPAEAAGQADADLVVAVDLAPVENRALTAAIKSLRLPVALVRPEIGPAAGCFDPAQASALVAAGEAAAIPVLQGWLTKKCFPAIIK